MFEFRVFPFGLFLFLFSLLICSNCRCPTDLFILNVNAECFILQKWMQKNPFGDFEIAAFATAWSLFLFCYLLIQKIKRQRIKCNRFVQSFIFLRHINRNERTNEQTNKTANRVNRQSTHISLIHLCLIQIWKFVIKRALV